MRYLLLLLFLAGCIDHSIDRSVDTEVNNTVVYQFAGIAVGDTIPNTLLVWRAEHAESIRQLVDEMYFALGGWKLSVWRKAH